MFNKQQEFLEERRNILLKLRFLLSLRSKKTTKDHMRFKKKAKNLKKYTAKRLSKSRKLKKNISKPSFNKALGLPKAKSIIGSIINFTKHKRRLLNKSLVAKSDITKYIKGDIVAKTIPYEKLSTIVDNIHSTGVESVIDSEVSPNEETEEDLENPVYLTLRIKRKSKKGRKLLKKEREKIKPSLSIKENFYRKLKLLGKFSKKDKKSLKKYIYRYKQKKKVNFILNINKPKPKKNIKEKKKKEVKKELSNRQKRRLEYKKKMEENKLFLKQKVLKVSGATSDLRKKGSLFKDKVKPYLKKALLHFLFIKRFVMKQLYKKLVLNYKNQEKKSIRKYLEIKKFLTKFRYKLLKNLAYSFLKKRQKSSKFKLNLSTKVKPVTLNKIKKNLKLLNKKRAFKSQNKYNYLGLLKKKILKYKYKPIKTPPLKLIRRKKLSLIRYKLQGLIKLRKRRNLLIKGLYYFQSRKRRKLNKIENPSIGLPSSFKLKTRGFLKVYLELKNRFNVQRITALKEDFDEYNETITLLDEAENPVEKEAPVDKKKKESPKSKEKILAVRKNTINKKLALKENSNKAKKKKQRFRKRVNTKSNRFNHRIRSRKKIKLLIGKYRKVSTLLKKVKFKQRLQKLKDNHPLIRPYLLGLRKFASEKRSSLYINLNEALVVNEERALSKSYFEDRMRLQIRQSRNNLFVTLLSSEGTVLDTLSVGAIGYKGPRRATPFAAAQLGRSCALKYLSRTKRKLLILIMSPIKAHIKSFVSNFFTHHNKVMGILNKIPVAHNGLREKKARRL